MSAHTDKSAYGQLRRHHPQAFFSSEMGTSRPAEIAIDAKDQQHFNSAADIQMD
jgi:hypothetical protein